MSLNSKTKSESSFTPCVSTHSKIPLLTTDSSNSNLSFAISNLQSSQANILASNKTLSESFSALFSDLFKNITCLANQLSELKSENAYLRNELSALKSKVNAIESSSVSRSPIISVVQLHSSRLKKYAINVLIHGLRESHFTVIADRIIDDRTHLSDILVPLSINIPRDYNLIRLSRLSIVKPRPLKIICSSKDEAVTLISEFGSARSFPIISS